MPRSLASSSGSAIPPVARSKQIALRAKELGTLIGDGTHENNDIPDHEHARALQLLRDIFVLARAGSADPTLSGQIIPATTRSTLLAAGIALHRMAPSSRTMRDELLRSAMLVVSVIFSDLHVSADEAKAAAVRSHAWLDEGWTSHLLEPASADLEDDATLCDAIGRGARRRGIVESSLRCEAMAYLACAECQLAQSVFKPLPSAMHIDDRPMARIVDDPVAQSLVEAADADLGQQVFRDLILSFRMPRKAVGWRRQLLFDRATAKVAERCHHEVLNVAHNAAMQTPSHVWLHGLIGQVVETEAVGDFLNPNPRDETPSTAFWGGGAAARAPAPAPAADAEAAAANAAEAAVHADPDYTIERTCAVLAGLSMNIANDVDQARKGDAFAGRVDLPFLRTTTNRSPGTLRLALVRGEWICYTVGSQGVRVHIRGKGLAGLVGCATALVDDVRGLNVK